MGGVGSPSAVVIKTAHIIYRIFFRKLIQTSILQLQTTLRTDLLKKEYHNNDINNVIKIFNKRIYAK